MSGTVSFADAERELAVVTTVTPWHEPPRIRHQVTRQLRRFYNVLYVELPFGAGRDRKEACERLDNDFVLLRPGRMPRGLGQFWENIPPVHTLYNAYLVRRIESTVRGLKYARAVLINFQHNLPQIMHSQLFSRKLYICNDEFPERATSRWKRYLLKRYEAAVASNADLCLAVSYPLLQKLLALTANARIFLPGHEFAMAEGAAEPAVPVNGQINVAYMGYINKRIRFDWLAELLKDSAIRLTLIGPVQDAESVANLVQFDNFRHLPPVEGEALREQLMTQNVLIMPYDTRQVGVRAASAPNKLFQYLACAKPIVISDMENFIDLPSGFIYRAADARGFVKSVHTAFEEDSEVTRRARLAYAAENTWDDRGNQLHAVLQASHRGDT